MEKSVLKKAGAIWKEIGQHKKPEELQVEIELNKKMLDLLIPQQIPPVFVLFGVLVLAERIEGKMLSAHCLSAKQR